MKCPACHYAPLCTAQQRCPMCLVDPKDPLWHSHQPATLRRRLFAALFDTALALPLLFASNALLEVTGARLSGFSLYWLNHLLYLLYFIVCAGIWSTSPGKKLLGMRLVDATEGKPLTWSQALWREGPGRFLCLLLLPVGYVPAMNKYARMQTLADEIGHSVVLRKIR